MIDFGALINILKKFIFGEDSSVDFKSCLEEEIKAWQKSEERKLQKIGNQYYEGNHDILKSKRTVIGEGGQLITVENLPNNQIVDNKYALMVDQKANYLLGKPLTYDSKNKNYQKALRQVLGKRFQKTLNNIGKDSISSGIGWMYIYYKENGELGFKRFRSWEVLPFWSDSERSELEAAIRLFSQSVYRNGKKQNIDVIEIYTIEGIYKFEWQNGRLIEDKGSGFVPYMTLNDKSYSWEKLPLIPFKYNDSEIPLIKRCKSLQDGINTILSNFQNNMEEDARNTILVVVNYDGQDLGEFRHNLATYGAVKVDTVDGVNGDVRTLTVEVNAENYKCILEVFKKALIENARGYDSKDDRLSGNPNEMNIQSMYSDIDLDANGMETEYQSTFEDLLWFVNAHLFNNGLGSFDQEEINVIFNRDIMISESGVIGNIKESVGILSNETLVSQHPYVDDVEKELARIKKEKQEEEAEFNGKIDALNNGGGKDGEDE